MTVSELIHQLYRIPGDAEVVFSDNEDPDYAIWLVIDDVDYSQDDKHVAILGAYEGWQISHQN